MPEIKKQPGFSEQLPESSELEKAKIEFLKMLKKGWIDDALKIKDGFNIPEDEIVETVKIGFLERLKEGWIEEILEIKNRFNIPEEFLESGEVVESAKIGFLEMLKKGWINRALEIKDRFNIPEDEIVESAKIKFLGSLKKGDIYDVLKIKNRFNIPEEFLESGEVVESAKIGFLERLKNRWIDDALKIKDKFNIPEEFLESDEVIEIVKIRFLERLKNGWIEGTLKIKDKFNIPEEFLESDEVIKIAKIRFLESLEEGRIDNALKIKDAFKLPFETIKILDKAYNIFGDRLTYSTYLECEKLLNGEISDGLREFGVNIGGEDGINQLNVKLREYGHNIIHEQEFDWENMLNSQIKRTAFQSFVQYTNSEWGSHGEEGFKEIVRTYLDVKQSVNSLSPEYVQSNILTVKKVKQVDTKTFGYSEQFLSSYNSLLESLKRGVEYAKKKEGGIREIIGKLEGALGDLAGSLEGKKKEYEEKLLSETDEKEKNKIERALVKPQEKIENISEIDLKSIQNPIELFERLHSFKNKEINELLKDLIIYIGIYKNENIQNKDLSELDIDKPTAQDISWVMNTIQHIVLQETVEPYFTKEHFDPDEKLKPKQRKKKEKELQKKIRKLLSTSTLNEELKKMKGDTSKDTISMKFIPQRNLLTEFSGHFSDSCWASKYTSILEEFPNFVSVAMIQNPDHPKYEKIAGGCFLIEAKAKNGDELLIIRGLNPQENLINQLSPKDFFEKFTKHFKKIAKKQGRKLAIVIDDHTGGSGTNRPVLFNFLDELRGDLKKVKLASDEKTNFNDYNIVNDCYLVE